MTTGEAIAREIVADVAHSAPQPPTYEKAAACVARAAKEIDDAIQVAVTAERLRSEEMFILLARLVAWFDGPEEGPEMNEEMDDLDARIRAVVARRNPGTAH